MASMGPRRCSRGRLPTSGAFAVYTLRGLLQEVDTGGGSIASGGPGRHRTVSRPWTSDSREGAGWRVCSNSHIAKGLEGRSGLDPHFTTSLLAGVSTTKKHTEDPFSGEASRHDPGHSPMTGGGQPVRPRRTGPTERSRRSDGSPWASCGSLSCTNPIAAPGRIGCQATGPTEATRADRTGTEPSQMPIPAASSATSA
jgi:hypothetical protein